MSLPCPSCHSEDSKVIDSRNNPREKLWRRRRECMKCGDRFTTHEGLHVKDGEQLRAEIEADVLRQFIAQLEADLARRLKKIVEWEEARGQPEEDRGGGN